MLEISRVRKAASARKQQIADLKAAEKYDSGFHFARHSVSKQPKGNETGRSKYDFDNHIVDYCGDRKVLKNSGKVFEAKNCVSPDSSRKPTSIPSEDISTAQTIWFVIG